MTAWKSISGYKQHGSARYIVFGGTIITVKNDSKG